MAVEENGTARGVTAPICGRSTPRCAAAFVLLRESVAYAMRMPPCYVYQVAQEMGWSPADDGLFWMQWEDFAACYHEVEVCAMSMNVQVKSKSALLKYKSSKSLLTAPPPAAAPVAPSAPSSGALVVPPPQPVPQPGPILNGSGVAGNTASQYGNSKEAEAAIMAKAQGLPAPAPLPTPAPPAPASLPTPAPPPRAVPPPRGYSERQITPGVPAWIVGFLTGKVRFACMEREGYRRKGPTDRSC